MNKKGSGNGIKFVHNNSRTTRYYTKMKNYFHNMKQRINNEGNKYN